MNKRISAKKKPVKKIKKVIYEFSRHKHVKQLRKIAEILEIDALNSSPADVNDRLDNAYASLLDVIDCMERTVATSVGYYK